jgi:hypothetical protein
MDLSLCSHSISDSHFTVEFACWSTPVLKVDVLFPLTFRQHCDESSASFT